ncbi:MAG: hypothetical protein HY775_09650 [Acidobacteria bacterium]|nr:hypothetical protein [Acidobacteriota bacterium]
MIAGARRLARDDSGVVLVLALVFLSLFGLAIASLLGFADASFRATMAVRDQRADVYAADGGLDGAINRVRGAIEEGRDPVLGINCDDTEMPSNDMTVTVRCEGEPGSGLGVGANPLSKPKHAILTLGTDPTEVGIEQTSNATLNVGGSIFSNSTIQNSGGAQAVLAVDGTVSATSTCTPESKISTTDPPLRCSNTGGGAIPADGTDPGYTPATTGPPPVQAVPSCSAEQIVQFQPGTYTDAGAMKNLFETCEGAVYLFNPAPDGVGVYYFDFQNPGSHTWEIEDASASIVGGTPKDWSPVPPRPAVPIPGGCKTEDDYPRAHGVQFIFGGDSRLELEAGSMEICPEPTSLSQQIAIYGLTTGSSVPIPAALVPTAYAGVVRFTSPINALLIDGLLTSDAALDDSNRTGSITLQSFLPAVPADATITSATLRIAHRESPNPDNVETLAATVTPGTGSPVALTPSVSGSMHTDSFDLLAAGMSNTGSALAGIGVRYDAEVKSGKTATARLDGIRIDVTYQPLAFRAQSGCVVQRPYPEDGCAFIETEGAQATLVVQGTVYAPAAAIDIELTNASTQVFRRGVISRIFRASVTPSAGFTDPVVRLLEDEVRADRVVRFTACVGGAPRLEAVVRFNDLGGLFPGQVVVVDSWSVRPAGTPGPC